MMRLIVAALFLPLFAWGHGSAEASADLSPLKPLNLDEETLEYLFSKAASLSGITEFEIDQLPAIYSASKSEMAAIVCPGTLHECDRLAAVFDDLHYRILILDSFDISSNFKPFDYSFLIHEIVHALQYLQRGPEIFKDCDAIYATELEAYTAQDRYLKQEGEFFRSSMALKFFYCEEGVAKSDYEQSKMIWDQRASLPGSESSGN